LKPEFKNFAKQIVKNAKALAETLMAEGIDLISGGTDNHLILADLTKTGVTGKEAEAALDMAGITVNKNMVPYDSRSPFDPSGIRMGTPCLTQRGMKEGEMQQIGKWIAMVIRNHKDEAKLKKIKEEVIALAKEFLVYR
ncbi:serine hydroxymethyltransferase, partial [Candidatus Woesearchaeota archaeon]|nr:serine hydroxymethyltransferase [Candidatus Woesearchaeota archaeon]